MAKNLLTRYLHDTAGGMTAFGLFAFATGLLMASYAIDVNSLEQQRTMLQVAADSAAHDALVTRELGTEGEAVTAAVTRAASIMETGAFGDVLDPQDVVFGTWDRDTGNFTAQSGSRSAVQVILRRTDANRNAIATHLLKLVGINTWDVVIGSTYATYQPMCLREGFVAEGVVDIQSNNTYLRKFCIHSNSYVKLSSNNYFEPGTIVSMPNLDDLQLPRSGYNTNVGLAEALKAGSQNIRVLRRIQTIIDEISNPSSAYYPDFLTNSVPLSLKVSRIDASDLQSGRIYQWNCSSGSGGTIKSGTLVKNVVIIANCAVTLGNGTALENAVLLTTSTSSTSIKGSNGFRMGINDGCADGGGGRIVSLGGMKFASGLEMYGSQLLAMGDVSFAAQADGIEGASIISNGEISGTSNMSMSYCGGGMSEFTADYFQLVD